jgi:hypothetical protein
LGRAIIGPLLAIKASLTALIEKAKRLVYLNSGVQRSADVSLQDIAARLQSASLRKQWSPLGVDEFKAFVIPRNAR